MGEIAQFERNMNKEQDKDADAFLSYLSQANRIHIPAPELCKSELDLFDDTLRSDVDFGSGTIPSTIDDKSSKFAGNIVDQEYNFEDHSTTKTTWTIDRNPL